MVKHGWSALLLLGALGACSSDAPTECPPRREGDQVTFATFTRLNAGDEDRLWCVDWNVSSRLDATATSPGRDESFATSRGGVIPWTKLTYAQAAEACGRAGKFLCPRRVLRGLIPGLAGELSSFPPVWARGLAPTSTAALEPTRSGFRWEEPSTTGMPDIAGSVAVWTAEGDILGRIRGDEVMANDLSAAAPIEDADFAHVLLGFRCCIDARLYTAFQPFPQDPQRVRAEVEDVPLR